MSSPKVKKSPLLGTFRKSILMKAPKPSPDVADHPQTWNTLHVTVDGKDAVLRFSSDVFEVNRKSCERILEKPTLRTSLRHVLYAEEQDNTITLSTLAKKSNRLSLVKVVAAVGGAREGQPTGAEWVRDLLQAAYLDAQPRRNFKILINPAGGPGKARGIFEKRIKPILDAARCVTDVTCTTHRGHAREIAMTLPLTYDAILLVSGDGLPHEVVNGFAQRLDARAAFERTAIVPIAAGSGNAFSVNLLGPQEGMDPVMGILNVIKGKPMKLDLASVTMQNSKETIYSFLTQTGGLMAELDLGTENLRWMGDTRFIVGFIRGLWSKTPRALKVTIRDPDNDKEKLLQSFLNDPPPPHAPDAEESNEIPARMPGPKYADEPDDAEGWVTFDKPILYMQGGLLPWVGRDLIDFPLKQPCDGSLHLVVQEMESIPTLITMIDGGAKGEPFFLKTHSYYKASAYRVAPAGPTSKDRECFSMDGERIPYEPFHVEVHKGIMHTYSMYGKFPIPPQFGKEGKLL